MATNLERYNVRDGAQSCRTACSQAFMKSCEKIRQADPNIMAGWQLSEQCDLGPTTGTDARAATLMLLEARVPGATVCPSEVARVLADGVADSAVGEWRNMMPTVHAVVDQLLAEGRIWLNWKGRPLAERAGLYRINRSVEGDGDQRM